jgi:hypothetical protein
MTKFRNYCLNNMGEPKVDMPGFPNLVLSYSNEGVCFPNPWHVSSQLHQH